MRHAVADLVYPVDVGFDLFGDLFTLVVTPGGGSSVTYCVGQSGSINPGNCTLTSLPQQHATAMAVDHAGVVYLAVTAPQKGLLVIQPNGTQTLEAVGFKGNITAMTVGP